MGTISALVPFCPSFWTGMVSASIIWGELKILFMYSSMNNYCLEWLLIHRFGVNGYLADLFSCFFCLLSWTNRNSYWSIVFSSLYFSSVYSVDFLSSFLNFIICSYSGWYCLVWLTHHFYFFFSMLKILTNEDLSSIFVMILVILRYRRQMVLVFLELPLYFHGHWGLLCGSAVGFPLRYTGDDPGSSESGKNGQRSSQGLFEIPFPWSAHANELVVASWSKCAKNFTSTP